jgi:hypothetical protein
MIRLPSKKAKKELPTKPVHVQQPQAYSVFFNIQQQANKFCFKLVHIIVTRSKSENS